MASSRKVSSGDPFLRRPLIGRFRRRRPTEYRFPPTCQIPELAERYRELFGGVKTDGTFVEVGAYDGDSFSNTSGLADLGWRGLYVEPVPRYARACARRHAANKHVQVASCAVGREVGIVELYFGEGLTTSRSDWVDVWDQIDSPKRFHTGERIRVQQLPLERLLVGSHVEVGFDLLVVDVEGSEQAVFDSFSLDVWKPRIIVVELVDHHPTFQAFDDVTHRSADLRSRIKRARYTEHYVDEVNTIFRRDGS